MGSLCGPHGASVNRPESHCWRGFQGIYEARSGPAFRPRRPGARDSAGGTGLGDRRDDSAADDDPDAVVDSRFRVIGTKGLRVVDASVFPEIPGTFIALPIFMMAERAATAILEDNQ